MTEYQQYLLGQFKQMAEDNNIPLSKKEFLFCGKEQIMYSVPYSTEVASFMSDITDIDISFIKQFTFANQMLHLLSDDFSFDIQVCLMINERSFRFGFKPVHNNFYEMDVPSFLSISVWNNSFIYKGCGKFGLNEFHDYERAYQEVLKDIEKILLPDMSFRSILETQRKSTVSVIQNRLLDTGFNVIFLEDFVSLYSIDNSYIFEDEYGSDSVDVGVTPKVLNSFLDSHFPTLFSQKMKNIISLACFQEILFNKKLHWAENVKNDVAVTFNHISKYAKFNTLYTLSFGISLVSNCRCTLFIFDDGSLSFCGDDGVERTNIDDVYNYIKEEFIKNIERNLAIDRSDMTLKHFDLCQMMFI